MAQNERILKAKVSRWHESFMNANSLAAAESSKQDKEISILEKSIEELETAKAMVEEEAQQERLNSKNAKKSSTRAA